MSIADVRRAGGNQEATAGRPLAGAVALFAGCLLLGLGVSQFGIRFLRDPALHVSVWWPLSGFALVLLVRLRPRAWPLALIGLAAGQFFTNLNTYYHAPSDALGILTAALGETVVIAVLLRRAFRGPVLLNSPAAAGRFALCAASGVAFGATVFALVQDPFTFALWHGYFRSHGLGVLVISPLFLVALGPRELLAELRRRRLNLEWAAQALVLGLVTAGVFMNDQRVVPSVVCMIPLLWGGLRLGTLRAMGSLLLMAVLATVGTLRGVGPIVQEPPDAQTLAIQLVVAAVSIGTLAVVLAAEQKSALLRLAKAGSADLVEAERIAGLGSSTWDLKTGEIRWSDGLYAQLGQTRESMPPDAESYVEKIHPDDRGVLLAALARVDSGEIPNMECRLLRPDHSWRTVLLRNRVDQDPDGRPAIMRSTVLDVTAIREAEKALQQAHTQLSGVLNAVENVGIVGAATSTSLITFFSPAAERMLGWRAEELVGLHNPLVYLSPADAERAMATTGIDDPMIALGQELLLRGHDRRRWTLVRKDGTQFPAHVGLSIINAPDGTPETYIATIFDLSPVLRAEAELQESQDRFRLAFEFAPTAMATVSLDDADLGRIRQANPALCRFTGKSEPELLECSLADLMTPAHAEAAAADLRKLLAGGGDSTTGEWAFHRADGGELWGLLSTSVVRPTDGRPPYLITMIEDITARMQLTERLRHEASHDPLTGLPNRQVLRRQLEDALAQPPASGAVAVLYVDLDGFKAVNDGRGHATGDELLVQVADRIAACVRASDVVSRLGGDEFAVLLPRVNDLDTARAIGERIVTALALDFDIDGVPCRIGASIGIALSPPDSPRAGDAPDLLNAADEAMYQAKRAGKGRVEVSSR
ncbi:diguanylate cyclase domain-containing protein [Kineosporia babensis]|uniref:Diguanylate cyclase n=1 Tax=Kineosporia babensis TaxID=499548 RepID=A0A9X1SUW0_9ACTN|nr:diguanylate cyclase [Kineosporia babensis]